MVDQQKSALGLWAAVFLVAASFIVIRAGFIGFDQVLFGDNDDAMRMVVVRDFLSGQNWFDHMQYRMNTPYGAEMHWSRLVDLPIAALVLLASSVAGDAAEIIAGCVWPMLLLGLLIWLNGQLTLRLVGRDGLLPGMLITAFSVVTFGEFDLGRVDHHSVQIILTQLAVLFSIDALRKPRAALWAGLVVATALAIGTEALPVVVGAILIYGMLYIAAPDRHAAVRWFGLAFGLGTVAHLVLALPPSLWLSPACDAISIVYAAAAFASGLGLVGLTLLPLNRYSWPVRLLAGVVAGSLVLALVAVLFPNCLAGPYAIVDPWLVEHWLNSMGEVMPLYAIIRTQPAFAISTGVPALMALLAGLHAVWRSSGPQRAAWLMLLAMLAIIVAVAFVQVRSIRLTVALIAPACAYWVVLARGRYLAQASIGRGLALLGSWLGFVGTLWAALAVGAAMALPSGAGKNVPVQHGGRAACLAPGAYTTLASLTPQRIINPLDLGAYLLLYTGHAIVAAPYHRNNQGLLDTFAFFNGPIDAGRALLERRGVTLVVTCDALAEMAGLADAAPDSFVRLAQRGMLPDWLEPVPVAAGPLQVYAVRPR